MNNEEFFAAVAKMRVLQKTLAKNGERDTMTKRECKRQEDMIDYEIKRVEAVLREQAQPRFFDI